MNIPKEVNFDSTRAGELVLSADEINSFVKKAAALKKLLDDDEKARAKYKLEVHFGKARRVHGVAPTPGSLSFWANGAKFHGGGDEKLYLCHGKSLQRSTSTALIHDAYNSGAGAVCPACGTIWRQDDLIGELMFNLPMRKWADVLYTYYRLCEYNCDIYLKFAPSDIRSTALAQAQKATWAGTQALDNSRARRAKSLYPLRNIIKDISSGADLLGRFYAFLVA